MSKGKFLEDSSCSLVTVLVTQEVDFSLTPHPLCSSLSSSVLLLVPLHATTVLFGVCWAVVVSQIFCCLVFFLLSVTLLFLHSVVCCLASSLSLLMHSLYPSRKRWDLGLSSSRCLVNPRRLSPSCSNQDPFSPLCVFMKLSVCLSVCCGGWWDVEWRFLWPVAPYVISQSWNNSLIHMPLLKHTPLKPVSALGVWCVCIRHLPWTFSGCTIGAIQYQTRLSRDELEPSTSVAQEMTTGQEMAVLQCLISC